MTWTSRLRLIFGVFIVIAILGILTLFLNYSMTHIQSRSAQLMADEYTVGTDYSGIITKQYVSQGQHVTAGQPLIVIKSSLLGSDISSGDLNKSQVAYSIDDKNQIVLKAANNGVVSDVMYLEGAFVPANKEVATITRDNSLYVTAKYELSPPDYARVKNGDYVTVTMPNNQQVRATIFDISVENNDNSVQAIVKARLDDSAGVSFTAGTPVNTELQLSGKTWYDSVKQGLRELFKPKG